MAKRTPPPGSQPQPSLPHDQDREGGQPYAKEVEDYAHGVAKPPEDQGGPEAQFPDSKKRRKSDKAGSIRANSHFGVSVMNTAPLELGHNA